MSAARIVRTVGIGMVAAVGIAAATYGSIVARAWVRYGRPEPPSRDEADPLLDRFVPNYDIVERHQVLIRADAATVMAAAKDMRMRDAPLVDAVFKARALAMGARDEGAAVASGIIEETKAMGWGVLAEVPGREIVVGAVTRPWEGKVTFISIPPDGFAAFAEPGYVKIAWTLRADETSAATTVFRTETRAIATDGFARRRFRRYWSLVSPGVWLIRRMTLSPLRREAERRSLEKPPHPRIFSRTARAGGTP